MKNKLVVSLVALALAPAMTFAQSQSTVTRDQVRAELIELQQVGYRGDTQAYYPANIQEAESRVAERTAQASKARGDESSAAGTSESGKPVPGRSK
ncbi:DUF4148 domain-containing protein [Paraburkholderia humisilvae]|uniref:DUF4148 domain-containing protein n=1 Tax=Paraburkholderia humisilvae TaxID=627669 RepID=A0A6J5EMA6_9BURK|nr:DUF4148 domain-containing protein [Paraburkholderia humisilvae]CAB3766944.1 hypothetical protein LMG29542_05481 [Paraburkholderia humisilvae]